VSNAYLVITLSNGTLLKSEYQIDFANNQYMQNPFPGRPALKSDQNPLFPLASFNLGVSTDVGIGSQNGPQAGKPHFKDLAVARMLDIATTTLFIDLVSGDSVKYADVLLTKSAGGNGVGAVFSAFGLGTVLFSSLQWSDDEEATRESVSLFYRKLWTAYRVQKPDGSYASWTVKGWDRLKNAPV
jgi:type VI protein secretion system component Hcp